MAYCPVCKVEVNDSFTKCPICGAKLVKNLDEHLKSEDKLFPERENVRIIMEEQRKNTLELRVAWLFSSVTLLIAFSILLVIGLKFIHGISWTKYPLVSIVFAWTLITTFIFLSKKSILMGILTLFEILIFLYVMDLFDKSDNWFFVLGAPATFLLYICATIFILSLKFSRVKGWNIIAYFLILIVIFCLGIDLLINNYVLHKLTFSWSLLVASVLIPLSLLFLYMHFVLKKRIKYKRFFHI